MRKVESLAAGAGLSPVGVFFPNINAEERARAAYRAAWPADAGQADLGRWHALESADPDLFGRLHSLVFARSSAAGGGSLTLNHS